MRILVVSDLHIHGPEDPLYTSLLRLLDEELERGDTLILAGDVFDLFIGNKPVFIERYALFLEGLKRATQRGAELHYIEGNHDFQIRGAFANIRNLTVYTHHLIFQKCGKKFFVAHGDTVDRSDRRYRLLRVFFRSPFMKAVVKLMPGTMVDKIGRRGSRSSRNGNPILVSEMAPRVQLRIRHSFRNFAVEKISQGYDFVILGHCHDLDEMTFSLSGRRGQYANVGYPRAHGSFLVWTPGAQTFKREAMPGMNAAHSDASVPKV